MKILKKLRPSLKRPVMQKLPLLQKQRLMLLPKRLNRSKKLQTKPQRMKLEESNLL